MKRTVTVTQTVTVDVKDDVFTQEMLDAFADAFYSFSTVDEHIEHLAQLAARGLLEPSNGYDNLVEFVEGYGPAKAILNSIEIEGVETVIEGASS